MGSPFWNRLPELGHVVAGLFSGLGAVRRGRAAVADGIRQTVPVASSGFAVYCWLLVLLGLITAGFVILPLGLLQLLQGLMKESVDRELFGGLMLCLVGLFYLVVPVLVLQVASRVIIRRLQRKADRLAERVAGER